MMALFYLELIILQAFKSVINFVAITNVVINPSSVYGYDHIFN